MNQGEIKRGKTFMYTLVIISVFFTFYVQVFTCYFKVQRIHVDQSTKIDYLEKKNADSSYFFNITYVIEKKICEKIL